jgi:hypothetical protein
MVILAVTIRARFHGLPDAQPAAEGIRVCCAWETRLTVSSAAEDIVDGLHEVLGQSQIFGIVGLLVEGEEIQNTEGIGPEISSAVAGGRWNWFPVPRKVCGEMFEWSIDHLHRMTELV